MVITYGAHLRSPYIGYQSTQIDPDHLGQMYVCYLSKTPGNNRDIQPKKISKPVNHPSLDDMFAFLKIVKFLYISD